MKWFLTKIVFQIITGPHDSNHQFDESFRMIQAEDISEAYTKAFSIGQCEQTTFLDVRNELVEWRFVAVPDVIEIGNLNDGVEVYSRTAEEYSTDEFIASMHSLVSLKQLIQP